MSYLSSTYVVAGYVRSDWFGSGTPPAPARYIGDNYLRPGYVLSSYLTNAGDPPTIIFVADTLNIGLGDALVTPRVVRLARTDSLNLALFESYNQTYKRHVVAADTLNLTLGETRTLRASSTVTDTLGVALTDTASNNEGTFVTKSASDTLDVTLDDPGINQAMQVLDTLSVGLAETSAYTVELLRSDTLNLSLGEAPTRRIEGAIVVQASDSLNLSLGESANRHIFRALSVSDNLDMEVVDVADIELGIITVYLQAFDTLDISVTDEEILTGTQDVVGKSAFDALNVSLEETTSKVELRFITVNDTLFLQVFDAAEVAKISVQQTWEEANYPWGGSTLRDIKPLPVFAYEFDFYQADSADTFITPQGVQGIPVVLERLGLTIYGRDRQGQWKEDPDVVKLVKGLYPIIRAEPGTVVNIYVGAQDDMEGAITWDGPHPFVVGTDTSVKPLISGPFIAVRFESAGQKPWKLLSYDLDITTVGRRN
jgi:hypothetical protein